MKKMCENCFTFWGDREKKRKWVNSFCKCKFELGGYREKWSGLKSVMEGGREGWQNLLPRGLFPLIEWDFGIKISISLCSHQRHRPPAHGQLATTFSP